MDIKLKSEFLSSYIDQYLDNCVIVELNEKHINFEVLKDDLLFSLNSFLEKEIHNILEEALTYWSWDLNLVEKTVFNSSLAFSSQVLREGLQEQVSYLKEDVVNKVKLLLEGLDVISSTIVEDQAYVGSVVVSSLNFSYCETVLKVDVLNSLDDLRKLLEKNPQIMDLKYVKGVFSSPQDFEQVFLVLFKNNSVIGLTHLMPSTEYKDHLSSTFTSILDQEQGRGYSALLLEKRFEYLKSQGKGMHQSSYSSEGFNRLRPKVLELTNKHQISLVENGLLGVAKSFSESVYSQQKDISRRINQARSWKMESININNQSFVLDERILVEFLKVNPHLLESEEELKMFLDSFKPLLEPWSLRFLN